MYLTASVLLILLTSILLLRYLDEYVLVYFVYADLIFIYDVINLCLIENLISIMKFLLGASLGIVCLSGMIIQRFRGTVD